MNRFAVAIALLGCTASAATAQTEGRVSAGASVTYVRPSSDGVASTVSIGPLVRLNPRRGWGVAGALNWFRADLENPSGEAGDFARLRVRPLMGGVAYTVGPDNVLTSFSVVAGPSFNRIQFEDDFLNRPAIGFPPEIDVDTSFAVRPGVSVTVSVAPRVGVVGFGGYIFNRFDSVYRDRNGVEYRNQWNADGAVLSVGVVYSLF